MTKPIPQYGRTIRLTKETLEGLLPYDSDPNHAFLKMKAEVETNRAWNNLPVVHNLTNAPQPVHNCSPCRFDEGAMTAAIEKSIRTTLESFRE